MDQRHAKLRACASCEWIFREEQGDEGCPKCGFAHYGARYVYGKKCYKYEETQQPWIDKEVSEFIAGLQKQIIGKHRKNCRSKSKLKF